MHKVKLTVPLLNLKGDKIMEEDGKTPATVRYVAISGLVAPCQAPGDEKFWRGATAQRLKQAGDEVELTADEVLRIRRIIGEAFASPEVVHAAWEALAIADQPAPAPTKSQQKRLAVQKGGKE